MRTTTSSRLRLALWIILPSLAVGSIALPRALAWGRHHHLRPNSPVELAEHLEGGLDHLLDKVDATDAQREQARTIAERRAPELFALMSEGRAARQRLKQVVLAEQLDEAQLQQVRAQLDALADRMADVGLSSMFELAGVLSPDQRKQLADRLARFDR